MMQLKNIYQNVNVKVVYAVTDKSDPVIWNNFQVVDPIKELLKDVGCWLAWNPAVAQVESPFADVKSVPFICSINDWSCRINVLVKLFFLTDSRQLNDSRASRGVRGCQLDEDVNGVCLSKIGVTDIKFFFSYGSPIALYSSLRHC